MENSNVHEKHENNFLTPSLPSPGPGAWCVTRRSGKGGVGLCPSSSCTSRRLARIRALFCLSWASFGCRTCFVHPLQDWDRSSGWNRQRHHTTPKRKTQRNAMPHDTTLHDTTQNTAYHSTQSHNTTKHGWVNKVKAGQDRLMSSNFKGCAARREQPHPRVGCCSLPPVQPRWCANTLDALSRQDGPTYASGGASVHGPPPPGKGAGEQRPRMWERSDPRLRCVSVCVDVLYGRSVGSGQVLTTTWRVTDGGWRATGGDWRVINGGWWVTIWTRGLHQT